MIASQPSFRGCKLCNNLPGHAVTDAAQVQPFARAPGHGAERSAEPASLPIECRRSGVFLHVAVVRLSVGVGLVVRYMLAQKAPALEGCVIASAYRMGQRRWAMG